MRILLVSDLHYALPQLDWVVRAAPEFDLVVLAGDHLDIASAVPLEAQSVVIVRYAALIADRTRCAISSGNHDLTAPDANGEQSAPWLAAVRSSQVATDGDSLVLGDTLVTICPWWDGDAGKAAVGEQLARDGARRPANWIWVYHWPPTDSPTSWTGKRSYGDGDLVDWIETYRPTAVLTGHVHQSPFKPEGGWVDRIGSTWVFNAGRQTGDLPAHIEIDLASGQATWVSFLGIEEQQLGDAVVAARTVF
jgi:Icc-related predicted phosphoesterase